MTNQEMIQKLVDKANVTEEAAKQALENSNWDLLDAMLYLEKNSPEQNVTASSGYSGNQRSEEDVSSDQAQKADEYGSFSWYMGKVVGVLEKLLKGSVQYDIVISKRGNDILSLPIIIFLLFLIFSFSGIIVLMVIGLFFDLHYRIDAEGSISESINIGLDKIYDAVQSIKAAFRGRKKDK